MILLIFELESEFFEAKLADKVAGNVLVLVVEFEMFVLFEDAGCTFRFLDKTWRPLRPRMALSADT